jgi:hypothetical protein
MQLTISASPPSHPSAGHTNSKKPEAEAAALRETEVDEAIATCGGDVRAALRATLIANAYLEAEIERLTKAISTGFARQRIRKTIQLVSN